MVKHLFLGVAFMAQVALPVYAAPLVVDYTQSEIGFNGVHAGNKFHGVFKRWQADIDFDFENPEKSTLKAEFQLNSAHTGNAMYDGTLPSADWFDVANSPLGTFESTHVAHVEDVLYAVEGTLTLRGQTHPVAFVAEITTEEGGYVSQSAFEIERLTYGIGEKSDPEEEWVDNTIGLSLRIVASAP